MRFDVMKTPTMETSAGCPSCSSDNVMFHPNRKFHCCDCKHEFILIRSVTPLRIFVIAAQFCESDKPDYREAPRVVPSLVFQLATRLPDYCKLLLTLPEMAELDGKDAVELFDYLLASALRSSINSGQKQRQAHP